MCLLVPLFNISSMHTLSDPYPGGHYSEMNVGMCPLRKRYLLSYLSDLLLRASQEKQEILLIFALSCTMKQELKSEEAISVSADVGQFLVTTEHLIEKEVIGSQMKKLKRSIAVLFVSIGESKSLSVKKDNMCGYHIEVKLILQPGSLLWIEPLHNF
ncbi:uncharacterized protein MONOS_13829 [Monocercomonoides exilis]|uniref:uncharacterized protein n=1 Tax=Monocercomonoides exilis TaxID=2049356 RepID=UPI003559DD5F|nr:hypothetical protein MONOS_13829 [Monocercomonoides exilis]|eukprot:MONOS_13829.1-p1 / transcript=MONOS_13829.1 / gene=MONOS_13829 / organism=Monocercomonoides_exilis_PA203 / gene_product=unspecified product / transcript_product=unspecified product / location=Mono_scaffold00890:19455-19925(-) / protein_length=157 / sequence_SO=supercontig / SO=protein_coding / is_pseudo=false